MHQGSLAAPQKMGLGWRRGSLVGGVKKKSWEANCEWKVEHGGDTFLSCAAPECRSASTCVYDESRSADRCLQWSLVICLHYTSVAQPPRAIIYSELPKHTHPETGSPTC